MKLWNLLVVLLLCGILFIFGINSFINVNAEFKEACADCTTQDCQDNDAICGDFGLYYFKLLLSVGACGVAIAIMLLVSRENEFYEEEPVKSYPLTQEQRLFLVEWFRSQDTPDFDGYVGHFTIPEEVMDEYKKLYPNDWD